MSEVSRGVGPRIYWEGLNVEWRWGTIVFVQKEVEKADEMQEEGFYFLFEVKVQCIRWR